MIVGYVMFRNSICSVYIGGIIIEEVVLRNL